MGTSELPYRYRINGTLNTSDGVLANMEKLANSAASWISFDMFTGKWDVVINKAESVSAEFNDSNIIGSIQLNILGLKDMYNSVEVQFPHSDLNGQKDYIRISIPAEDRLPGEPDNNLTINYDLLSDPVQAQFLGLVELKQSRLDKTIVFRADYSKINIPAGAVISVTNTTFGWTSKQFRIVTVKEISDNDALHTEITAIEYDANTYSTDDLYRYIRSNATGIITFGAIGQPDAPQVTKFEGISRPGILIEADVPGGLVNGMEFWLTRDTTIGSDENRNYNLIGTVYGTGGQNLTQGDTVEIDYDTLDTGNLYVKTRGINGDITGPYSVPSGLINYNAKQVTDAIGGNTAVNDSAGNSIGGLLGMNGLMWLLNQLMSGGNTSNTAATISSLGSLFGITGNIANTLSGVLSNTGTIAEGQTGLRRLGISSTIYNAQFNSIQMIPGTTTQNPYSTDKRTYNLDTFVAPYTGTYKVNYNINWGGSGDPGPDGVVKTSEIVITGKTLGQWSNTGDSYVQLYEDHNITGFFTANAGETIALKFRAATDWGGTRGSGSSASVWIIATVDLIPN
jgi:hypothetical protein